MRLYKLAKDFNKVLIVLFACPSMLIVAQDTLSDVYRLDTCLSAYCQNRFSNDITNNQDITAHGDLSLSEYLQGRIAGLDVMSANGDLGRSLPMIVQGLNISGHHLPLIVIDGVPQYKLDNLFNGISAYGADIHRLIPVPLEDIMYVRVIKNPRATVLYGAEGVDGVIEIQTKAMRSQGMQVDYSYSLGFSARPPYPEMLTGDEYVMLQQELYHNRYGVSQLLPEISNDIDFDNFHNYNANTNWLDEVTQVGSSNNHYLSIRGNSDQFRYSTSFDYEGQTGNVLNTGHRRFLNRTKLDTRLSEKLSVGVDFTYVNDQFNDAFDNGRSILEMAYIKAPNMSVWEYDADGNTTGQYFTPYENYQGSGLGYYNPVAVAQLGHVDSDITEFIGTFHAQFALKEWFTLKEAFTYNWANANKTVAVPDLAFSHTVLGAGIKRDFNLELNRYRNELQALLQAPFKSIQHKLSAQLGWVYQSIADSPVRKKQALSTAVNYALNARYSLDINALRTSFPESEYDDNTDLHYGVFLGWDFLKEYFLEDVDVMSHGLLRGGYSISGFNWLNHNTMRVPLYLWSGYRPPNQQFELTFQPKQHIAAYNLGLDIAFFNDRLAITADYFKRQIDTELAYFSRHFDGHTVQNVGFETTLKWQVVKKQDFAWDIGFNLASNSFTISELADEGPYGNVELLGNNYLSSIKEGSRPGAIYGLIHQGIFSKTADAVARDQQGNTKYDSNGTPIPFSFKGEYRFEGGDVKYLDKNYDGVIDSYDVTYLGNSYPKYVGGLSSHFSYKNLSLSMNFHYRLGYEIINQVAMDAERMSTTHNQSASVLNRWRVPGDNINLLHRPYLDNPANSLGSDRYVESGNFLKLNYLSLSYRLGADACEKMHLSTMQFSLTAQNLFTLTNYTGVDPETETQFSMITWQRKDEMRNYSPRVFALKVQVRL